uniref:Uncharacterized protein n=1 Tax=Pseudomonas phage KV2023 TaxID=3234047 RepID=A0AB39C6N9_9CAUD
MVNSPAASMWKAVAWASAGGPNEVPLRSSPRKGTHG